MTGSYFEDVPLEHVEETPGLTITSAHVAIYLGLTRELADDGGAVPDVLPLCFTTGLCWRVSQPSRDGLPVIGQNWQLVGTVLMTGRPSPRMGVGGERRMT